jgi:GTPase SAR1 family protein
MPNQIASKFKVVVMSANRKTGASCLAQRLSYNEFSEHYVQTKGADLLPFSVNSSQSFLRVLSGAEEFQGFRPHFLGSVNMVLYCVDLSTLQDSSIEKIKQEITKIKQQMPTPHVILVATKSDLYLDNSQDSLNHLSQQVGSDECLVTSAKTEAGIAELKDLIDRRAPNYQNVQNGQRQTLLTDNARNSIVLTLAEDISLTAYQQRKLLVAVEDFDRAIVNENARVDEFTQTFVTDCHRILEGEHPDIMAAVYTFAAAVVVAGVIALAGVAFGVAVLPLSITSGIGAAVTAGLTLNSIFKDRSHKNLAIDHLSQQVLENRSAPAVS